MFKCITTPFECENSQFNGRNAVSDATYQTKKLRVDFCDIGEGVQGDYNPDDPTDLPLLRFDVYKKVCGKWEALDNGSYCTTNTVFTPVKSIKSMLRTIHREMSDVLDGGYSGKKTAEGLSWITP
ncbi:unnamed protein product [marine sediment metagenome]|uniref:Uncharacterized protein n=1 Tax=marine sediment metagenome TaxID=412755 RepID=X0TMZ9_9ZZZZ